MTKKSCAPLVSLFKTTNFYFALVEQQVYYLIEFGVVMLSDLGYTN